MMLPQRARDAESRVKNKSSNGPLRVQSNALILAQSILQRGGMRKLSEIFYVSCECAALPQIKVATRIRFVIRP